MAGHHSDPSGLDLALGIALADLPDGGRLVGHRDVEAVLLVRRGAEIFAVAAASCSHYGGPLGRRPRRRRHASAAPGITPASICAPERPCARRRCRHSLAGRSSSAAKGFSLAQKREKPSPAPRKSNAGCAPERIVIVGGGARRLCRRRETAARTISGRHRHDQRRRGAARRPAQPFEGLSRRQGARRTGSRCAKKAFMPGTASICAWQPGLPASMSAPAEVVLADGARVAFDKLLLATGAEPVRLTIPGAEPASCPHAALASRQPQDHRANRRRTACGRPGRQLHRPRGCRRPSDPRCRSACGGARRTADGTGAGPPDGRLHPRPT